MLGFVVSPETIRRPVPDVGLRPELASGGERAPARGLPARAETDPQRRADAQTKQTGASE